MLKTAQKTALPSSWLNKKKHQQQTSKQSSQNIFNLAQNILQKADEGLATQSTQTCLNWYSKTSGKFQIVLECTAVWTF